MKATTNLLKGYEVSRITHIPQTKLADGKTEGDFHNAHWSYEDCPTKQKARALGRRIAKDTNLPLQVAHIRGFVIEERAYGLEHREYTSFFEEIA